MINNVNFSSLKTNNNISFKSSFRKNEMLEGYLKRASNTDLVEFYHTLDLMNKDGKNDEYFMKESFIEVYDGFLGDKVHKKEITVSKFDTSDMKIKKLESMYLGGKLLELSEKDVIYELNKILRRNYDFFYSADGKKELIKGIKKLLI